MPSHGTECVKSTEMLKLPSSSRHHDTESHRSRNVEEEVSVGKASDVWSLGCLLFELPTGEFLLYDEDWLHFYMCATSSWRLVGSTHFTSQSNKISEKDKASKSQLVTSTSDHKPVSFADGVTAAKTLCITISDSIPQKLPTMETPYNTNLFKAVVSVSISAPN